MNEFNDHCFPVGLCEYPIQIEYEWDEDKVRIHLCRIDVSGDADTSIWATVEPDSYPAIERQLKKELEEASHNELYSPPDELPHFLRRQAH